MTVLIISEQCSSRCSHVTRGSATVATIIAFTLWFFQLPPCPVSGTGFRHGFMWFGTALQKPFLQKPQQTLEKKG